MMQVLRIVLVLFFTNIFILSFGGCSHSAIGPESCRADRLSPEEEAKMSARLKDPEAASKNVMVSAIFDNDSKKVKELVTSGYDLKKRDAFGYSFLHLAAGVGNSEIIETLIDGGISVNLQLGKKKSTPAHSAVHWGKLSALKTLIQRGADMKITDVDGNTPQQIAQKEDQKEILEFFNRNGEY